LEFSFANSGITGTGTFCAFPLASAGLYAPDEGGAAEATGDETLEVGDAVVVCVSELPAVGDPPWQPLRSTAATTTIAAVRARRGNKAAYVRRGMAKLPSSCFR
jgi:hypothetical protein